MCFFTAGWKSTLSWAYAWIEMHKTRFLWLLQAVSAKSSVGNEKIRVLADCPGFAAWSNFCCFFGRLEDDASLRLRMDRIGPNWTELGFSGFSRPFHLNQALETFGAFSAGSTTTLSCASAWTELHQTALILPAGATFGGFSAGWKSTLSWA